MAKMTFRKKERLIKRLIPIGIGAVLAGGVAIAPVVAKQDEPKVSSQEKKRKARESMYNEILEKAFMYHVQTEPTNDTTVTPKKPDAAKSAAKSAKAAERKEKLAKDKAAINVSGKNVETGGAGM